MSSEVRLAFAHPSERAIATAGDDPRDRISLRDHIREVEIGAFQQERGTTQRICFNIVVEVAPQDGPVDDDVDRILSYDRVTEAIAHELAAERLNLLETLAERIATRILREPQAIRVFVRIEKLDRGPGALGVEIVRSRHNMAGLAGQADDDAPHPRVVFLPNAAVNASNLSAWIDTLEAAPEPVVLCVGRPDAAAPQAGSAMPQRRIDLLAIEQNAWVLASRDPRCVVVTTRTELDWAMKHRRISVWAPSKIVLDSVEGPGAALRDPLALADWFARILAARELLVIGQEAPTAGSVPHRALPLDRPGL
ncbi:MAG: dihydroneopterin aldolase [Roseivivax sp.]|nr:dihydroneopterin aldolase [Roseivivax sp.]